MCPPVCCKLHSFVARTGLESTVTPPKSGDPVPLLEEILRLFARSPKACHGPPFLPGVPKVTHSCPGSPERHSALLRGLPPQVPLSAFTGGPQDLGTGSWHAWEMKAGHRPEARSETHTSHPHPRHDQNCQAGQKSPGGFLFLIWLEVPRESLPLRDLVTFALGGGNKQEIG